MFSSPNQEALVLQMFSVQYFLAVLFMHFGGIIS